MGQHRRFPGSFLIVFALLAIPSVLYGFVTAAERADECEASAKEPAQAHAVSKMKCER